MNTTLEQCEQDGSCGHWREGEMGSSDRDGPPQQNIANGTMEPGELF